MLNCNVSIDSDLPEISKSDFDKIILKNAEDKCCVITQFLKQLKSFGNIEIRNAYNSYITNRKKV